MNRTELISVVAKQTGVDVKTTTAIFDAVVNTVKSELVQGRDIWISDIGRFSRVVRAARMGRNPRTGAAVQIPESKSIKFRPSAKLKTALNL